MRERPRLTGLFLLTDDLGAALLAWRSLGFRVTRLEGDRAVLEGQDTVVYMEAEPDGHRAHDLYPLYVAADLAATVDAFESQGGRTLETRLVGSAPVHLMLAPTGHRLALTAASFERRG